MRVILSKIIPFDGFSAVNLCGFVFVRKELWSHINEAWLVRMLNHEAIHTAQMKEMGYIFFYPLYLLEWIYRIIFHNSTAYIGISFEREAYANERNEDYLKTRKHFAQWRKKK